MTRKINRQSGLTLVEILVVMFITAVAGGLLLVIMSNSLGLFYKESSQIGQGVGANDVFSVLKNSIKEAGLIAASYTNGTTTYTSGPNQLVLRLSSLDSSGNMIRDTYDYFVFFQDQRLIRLKTFPSSLSQRKAADRVLSGNVDKITFQYLDKTVPPAEVSPASAVKVRATLILEQQTGPEIQQTVATAEANLRND